MIADNLPCQSGPSPKVPKWITFRNKVVMWLYLKIWCRIMYRHVMRLIHKFGLHYAPAQKGTKSGEREHWCEWCGLRGKSWVYDPNKSIEFYLPKLKSDVN